MNNLIKSRRGIAIEIAIGAMFVMIALSIVLLSISGMQSAQGNRDLAEFQEKIDMYELTDKVISGEIVVNVDQPTTFKAEKGEGNEYTVSATQGTNENELVYKVSKTIEEETTVVLTFTAEVKTTDDNKKIIQITSWGK